MTVHMVRVFCEPPKGEAENAVNNWVVNHNEWENDPVDHSLIETTASLDGGTVYVRGDYRFIQEESPTELLDALENRLSSIQGELWYRIGYHGCTHDEDTPSPCSWDSVRESGTIPSDIPVIDP